MAFVRAFDAYGPTILVAAAASAPTGVQASSSGAPKAEQWRIHNAGTATVFIAYGVDAATAQANAVIPTGTGANSKRSYPLVAGGTEVFSAPIDTYWSAIIGTGTASVYITPGRGL